MDELTLLREFRDTAPAAAPPDVRRRALAPSSPDPTRSRRPTRRPTGRHARRPALRIAVAATLVVVAGGVTATTLAPTEPSEAAVVLGEAARLVSRQPDPVAPRPDQWLYERVLSADPLTGEPGTHPGESWSRFDGAQGADRGPGGIHVQDIVDWPLGTPREWYDVLASLPESPDAVLQYLRDDPLYASTGSTQADRDFDEVTQALTAETFVPPQSRARLFLALAQIPGVGVDDHAAPDLVGRPVLSVTYSGDLSLGRKGDLWELLLDPATYAVLGLRGTAGADFELTKGEVVSQGTTWYEIAVLADRVVDRPGDTR